MSDIDLPRKLRGKNGNMFPSSITAASMSVTPASVAETIAGCLRQRWGQLKHAPKQLARRIDTNERTASNLLEGRNAPSAATLIKLMADDDEVFAAVLRLANRQPPAALDETQRRMVAAALRILEGGNA